MENVTPTSNLIGISVENKAGEDLGSIKDLAIDFETGCVAYAVLSFGGVLGLGDKLFAVPWSALMYDASNNSFTLDVEKESLEDAPGFDKDNWPDMADQQWGRSVHKYYGVEPYWETTRIR
jgi:sporulation protein YlmC with PRC-barrel domain